MTETATATFGGGCFWCVEAAFVEIDGVTDVTSGYAGGHTEEPTYREVCSGETGHAEVVQLTYDPEVVAYDELLEVFFTIHDPTQLNRQGPDVGTQYRSIVLYHDETQHEYAERYIGRLERDGAYDGPIVTEVEPLETFYEAEEKHQDYYGKNPADGYCRRYAEPKVRKVRETFETTPSASR